MHRPLSYHGEHSWQPMNSETQYLHFLKKNQINSQKDQSHSMFKSQVEENPPQ